MFAIFNLLAPDGFGELASYLQTGKDMAHLRAPVSVYGVTLNRNLGPSKTRASLIY